MKSAISNKIFDSIVYLSIALSVLICVLPFMHVLALSLSGNEAVMAQKVTVLPMNISLKAYNEVFTDESMIRSLVLTIYMTAIFTVIGLLITVALAYPLSRKGLKGRGFFMLLILFTFYFNAGMIPNYINIQELGLINNIWGLILPLVLSPYNMILMRTYLMTALRT